MRVNEIPAWRRSLRIYHLTIRSSARISYVETLDLNDFPYLVIIQASITNAYGA